MNGRKQKLYEKVFQFFRDAHQINPQTLMCDFERAMKNAAKSVWRSCIIRGCLFHYEQAILRKAKRTPKIAKGLKKSTHVKQVMKMMAKIPLLPEDKLEEGLLETLNYQKTHRLSKMFKTFNQYYIKQWSKQCFISDDFDLLTNNFCESFNSKLKRLIHKNPSTFMFLSKIDFLEKIFIIKFNFHS